MSDACEVATPERLSGRLELWLIFLLVAGGTLAVGLRGRLVDLHVNWDALAAVAHAYDVFNAQAHANLAMIGFVQPPLPGLLQLPLVLIAPGLATSGIAANVLGAVCLGVSAILLLGLSAECGLPKIWRWLLVGLFVLHPLVLGPAATGAPMALLTTLLLGGAWGLLRWSRTESLRDLIAASVVLSGAVITRYEASFIVAGVLIFLAWRTWRQDRSASKLEGTLIAFGLPIVYVAGIWIIANWAIMGDPWHFLRETYDVRLTRPAGETIATILRLSLLAFFPVFGLTYHQIYGAGRHPACARPVAWMVLTALLAPVIFPRAFTGAGDGDLATFCTLVAMVVAGGFAMVAAIAGDLIHRRPLHGPLAESTIIVATSLVAAVWLYAAGAAAPLGFARTYVGHSALADTAQDEIAAAELLQATDLPLGQRHIVAGWPGFAVVLFAERTGEISVIRTEQLLEAVDTLWVGSRLVLLVADEPDAVPETAITANLGLPSRLQLEEEWAAGPWRCYRVIDAGA